MEQNEQMKHTNEALIKLNVEKDDQITNIKKRNAKASRKLNNGTGLGINMEFRQNSSRWNGEDS